VFTKPGLYFIIFPDLLGVSMPEKIEGQCFFYSETGTEGGYWAFQDRKYIDEKTGGWSYEGLHVLENGDHLTIFDPQSKKVIWDGVIDLIELGLFTDTAFGFWIHNDQKGMEREKWAEFFFKECPGELIKKNPR